MRFQNKKISARATALALVLGVVGVLVTALPAFAVPTDRLRGARRHPGVRGSAVTITGTGLPDTCGDVGDDRRCGRSVHHR